MIYRFMGGKRDGQIADSEEPGWGGFPLDGIPEPVIQVDCCAANLTIYRLAAVDPHEALYVADDAATADLLTCKQIAQGH